MATAFPHCDKGFVPPPNATALILNELSWALDGHVPTAWHLFGTLTPQAELSTSCAGHQEAANTLYQMWVLSPQLQLLFSLQDSWFLSFYQIAVITKASLTCSKAPIKPLVQGLFGLGVFQLGGTTYRHDQFVRVL